MQKHLTGAKLQSLDIIWPKVTHNFNLKDYNEKVRGKEVKNLGRIGKYIILNLDNKLIAVHLRMTGKLYVQPKSFDNKKHTSAIFSLDSGKDLIFEDTRKFGRIYLYNDSSYLDSKIGIEPLSKEFNYNWLSSGLKKKQRKIKPLLLDQSFIAGLGNIYTDEALWRAKIHPESISNAIPNNNVKKLAVAIKKVLSDSINSGGTTIRDYTYDFSYVGNYAVNLKAYGKEKESCTRCKKYIIKTRIAQRGTYICTHCQKIY